MNNVQVSNGEPSKMLSGSRNALQASSRLASFKDLVNRSEYRTIFEGRKLLQPGDAGYVEGSSSKQSWKDWAGDKFRRKGSMNSSVTSAEKLSLFPGWATRKYDADQTAGKDDAFSLQLFVSGYAASYPLPEYSTRSQRAFMRMARAFASLPKLPDRSGSNTPLNADDIPSQMHLPPTPSEITEESELAELEFRLRKMQMEAEGSESSDVSDPPSPMRTLPNAYFAQPANGSAQMNLDELLRQHMALTERLQPFWSRSLANRAVRLSVYSSFPVSDGCDSSPEPAKQPVASTVIYASPQGSFQANMTIPWEVLCVHPGALFIAFGDASQEHELYVRAELLSAPVTRSAALEPTSLATQMQDSEITTKATLTIPLTHSQIRLISDIDDTIKLSNVLGGARAIFKNVFVRHLEELVIKGMGDWYTNMWKKGVRFHYVSNGPFQLLPVINDFIRVSNLPQGSIKLRSYAGRSLFNGLLSAPATRKRAGLVEVLDAFDSSRFFLVGDSGEQDLELYAQLASERPHQILAVFIRDASGSSTRPIDDPTGEDIKRAVLKQKRPQGPKKSLSFGLMSLSPFPTTPNVNSLSVSAQPTPTQADFLSTPAQRPAFADRGKLGGLRIPYSSFQSSRRKAAPLNTIPDNTITHDDADVDYLSFKPVPEQDAQRGAVRSPSDPSSNQSNIIDPFFDNAVPPGPTVLTNGAITDSPPSSSPLSTPSRSSASTPTPTVVTPTSSCSASSAPQQQQQQLADPRVVVGSVQLPGVLRPQEVQALPAVERKRYDLQLRVYKARLLMPSHIPLRIFTDPGECVEADRVLGELGSAGKT